jgi:hypothetical protein
MILIGQAIFFAWHQKFQPQTAGTVGQNIKVCPLFSSNNGHGGDHLFSLNAHSYFLPYPEAE